jgi:chemotaxis protein MotD
VAAPAARAATAGAASARQAGDVPEVTETTALSAAPSPIAAALSARAAAVGAAPARQTGDVPGGQDPAASADEAQIQPAAMPSQPPSSRPGTTAPATRKLDDLAPSAHHTAADTPRHDLSVPDAPAADAAAGPASAPLSMGAGGTASTSSASPAPAAPAAPPQAPVPLAGVPVLIAGRAFAGDHRFDIRLDPPELGRIEVRLKVDKQGQVSSHLIADRADTLSLLRRDEAGLQRALQDAGFKTGGESLQFSLRDQGGGQQDGRASPRPALAEDETALAHEIAPRGYVHYSGRVGGLDIRI